MGALIGYRLVIDWLSIINSCGKLDCWSFEIKINDCGKAQPFFIVKNKSFSNPLLVLNINSYFLEEKISFNRIFGKNQKFILKCHDLVHFKTGMCPL